MKCIGGNFGCVCEKCVFRQPARFELFIAVEVGRLYEGVGMVLHWPDQGADCADRAITDTERDGQFMPRHAQP